MFDALGLELVSDALDSVQPVLMTHFGVEFTQMMFVLLLLACFSFFSKPLCQ